MFSIVFFQQKPSIPHSIRRRTLEKEDWLSTAMFLAEAMNMEIERYGDAHSTVRLGKIHSL